MSWEQHRYAVERAARIRREFADKHNEMSPSHVNLQAEANGSDVEMLEEVAEFLKALEGYDDRKGSIGFLDQLELGQAFIAEWNKSIATISVFCDRFGLPKPDMIFPPEWQHYMNRIAGQHIGSPIIYAGVRVRFGKLAPMDVLVVR